MRILVSLLVFLLYCQSVNGQSSPVFRHFTAKDGLPGSQVYQVVSDSSGVLWFATDHGLVSYNGYEFKTWSQAEGLSDNTVFKLFLDRKNVLWMQTYSGGLFYLKGNRIYPYKFNQLVKREVLEKIPLGFYVSDKEVVHFTSTSQFEVMIDDRGNVKQLVQFGNVGPDAFTFLHECAPDRFLGSSSNVLANFQNLYLIYKDVTGKLDTLAVPHKELGHITAKRLSDKRLLVFIGYYGYILENGRLTEIGKLPYLPNGIFEDRTGLLWISSYNGVIQLDLRNGNFNFNAFLDGAFVSAIGEDIEKVLWVTTVNKGVFSLADNRVQMYSYENKQQQEPLALASSRESVYASFWNGYLLKLNSRSSSVFHVFPADQYISNILFDINYERLYVAKYISGYFEKGTFYPSLKSRPFALKGRFLALPDGSMLNPTVNGLYWLGPQGVFHDMALTFRANELCFGPDSLILLAASDGLYSLNVHQFRYVSYSPELKGKRVNAIAYNNGFLVAAVRGEGVWIRTGGKWSRLDASQGLCSDFINRIVISDDDCWCSSSGGLSRFSLSSLSGGHPEVVNFTSNNVLKEDEINDILVFRDTVWVASKNAVCFFPAALDPRIKIKPRIILTGVKVNNQEASLNGSLELEHDQNNISVSYVGISPSSKGAVIYRYQLISFRDTFESFTTNRQVDFPALGDGRYVFKVYAKNVHGEWSDQPVSFAFTVKAPFWKQWWFLLLVSVLLIAAVYLFVRYRIQSVRKEQEWKSGLERQLLVLESKALRAQMNPHFIFNVMNSIQDFILKNDMKSAQKYLTKFARLVRMILDNSVQSDVLLDEELKANRLYVELEQQRFNDKFDFVFEIEKGLEESGIRIPSMLIQPFLENAIKHGIGHLEGFGHLRLSVARSENNLIVEIEDNGVGRKAAAEWNALHQKEHQSMGSMLTEKRVEILNTALHAGISLDITDLYTSSGSPCGTRVRLLFAAAVEN